MRRRLRSSPGCRWEQQGVHRGQRGRPRPAAADALEPSAVGTGAREAVVEQQTVPRLQETAAAPGAASKSGSWTELIMTTEDSRAGERDLLRLLLAEPR